MISGWCLVWTGEGIIKNGTWITLQKRLQPTTKNNQKQPGGSVAGPRKWWKWVFRHSEERFLSLKTSPKKRSIYFVNNNPSMTSAWKRATATFSQIFFNVSAVVSIRFLPVHSHRHWKERMHFHIWGLRAWPFFEGKLPGVASLRTFQNPSTWPVWILTFPLFFRVLVRQSPKS